MRRVCKGRSNVLDCRDASIGHVFPAAAHNCLFQRPRQLRLGELDKTGLETTRRQSLGFRCPKPTVGPFPLPPLAMGAYGRLAGVQNKCSKKISGVIFFWLNGLVSLSPTGSIR